MLYYTISWQTWLETVDPRIPESMGRSGSFLYPYPRQARLTWLECCCFDRLLRIVPEWLFSSLACRQPLHLWLRNKSRSVGWITYRCMYAEVAKKHASIHTWSNGATIDDFYPEKKQREVKIIQYCFSDEECRKRGKQSNCRETLHGVEQHQYMQPSHSLTNADARAVLQHNCLSEVEMYFKSSSVQIPTAVAVQKNVTSKEEVCRDVDVE